MAAVRPVEVNEKGHSVYRWSAEWPECCWWKADEHTLVLEEDEVDYTIEHAPNCCNSYAHPHNPFGQKTESRRTPYAQLGSVAKDDKELPMCCVNVPIKAVTTDRMILKPGRQGEVPECPPCVGCFLVEGGTLCGNQNFTARSCRIAASSSTPSTRRLLDSVVVLVPHRSTEPARPRHRREMT